MTTAFVLSGGGSLGAVQVGMLSALHAHGLRPDLLVGTSAGAINAGYVAAHGFSGDTIEGLGRLWQTTRRTDVFPFDPLRHLLAIGGRRPSLCSSDPLRRLIAEHVDIERFDQTRLPVHVVATEVMSGRELLVSSGGLPSAILASAAIPGVFDPVERDGAFLMDGGVSDNVAISQAVKLGADRIVVLPAGFACALPTPPRSLLAAATHALTLLIAQRLVAEVAALRDQADIVVLPPLCPLSLSPVDFSAASELMTQARAQSDAWLRAGNDRLPQPERFLSLHTHPGLRVAVTHPHRDPSCPSVTFDEESP